MASEAPRSRRRARLAGTRGPLASCPPMIAEPAPRDGSARSAPRRVDVAVSFALAATALWLFRGALSTYFAQEDFRGLAVAHGLLPRHAALWRYLSVQTFMDVLHPLFGDRPEPYHAVSLALHVANATGLYLLLAHRLSRPASLVGAAFFATHPSLFTALYWLSARSDLLAASFALLTLAWTLHPGRHRWLAVPSFALALLSKESVILLPLAAWWIARWAGGGPGTAGGRRAADPLLVTLGAMSLLFGLALASGRAGIEIGRRPEDAYALDFGAAFGRNLLTYVGWTADLVMLPRRLRFLDIQDPGVFWIAWLAIILWGAGCASPRLRARGWHVAGAAYLLLLLPVLPLRNHTYRYFSYAALLPAGWCAAVALDLAEERLATRWPALGRARWSWALAALCLLLLASNEERLTRRMESRRMREFPALHADPIVDRASISRNVIEGLRRADLPEGTNLAFVLRQRLALLARVARGSGEAPPPAEASYFERNVRTALFDGWGVRALVPRVASVTFSPDPLRTRDRLRYAIYSPAGAVEVYSEAGLDSLLRSRWITHP